MSEIANSLARTNGVARFWPHSAAGARGALNRSFAVRPVRRGGDDATRLVGAEGSFTSFEGTPRIGGLRLRASADTADRYGVSEIAADELKVAEPSVPAAPAPPAALPPPLIADVTLTL